MLHIKDIEAFARINEALARGPGSAEGGNDGDLSDHPAVRLARLMAAAQAEAEAEASAEAAATKETESAPEQPLTMAGLFSRMMFGRR